MPRPPTKRRWAPGEAERLRQQVTAELLRRRTPEDLQPKQRTAYETVANELLYGGAAGGGKSHLMRRAAITWCGLVPGLQVYIFRREFGDLFKNHMEGPTGFPVMLADAIARGDAKIIWSKNQIRFKNKSVIHLCHAQHEKDVWGYQGAEIHVLIIDELTQWTRKMYAFLRSRVRLGGLKVPKWLRGVWLGAPVTLFPRILLGANPGGIGHNWVKADFIDPAPPMKVWQTARIDGGMRRQFIPALLEDNPALVDNDPDYEVRLEGLGDPALVKAMRSGDWDIVSGGMFDDLWKRDVHVLKPFPIPSSWKVDRSFDWGSSKPFSVGWWAESDGTAATMPDGSTRIFPRGTVIRIAEWYGCVDGRPDTGLKMLSVNIAKGILEREKKLGLTVRVGPADPSIFTVEDGKSIANEMAGAGVRWHKADNSPGSRKSGWEQLRKLLGQARENPRELPGLYVFDNCVAFIRTVPVLPRDDTKTDDVDTDAEDHTGDETRYRIMKPKRTATTSEFHI